MTSQAASPAPALDRTRILLIGPIWPEPRASAASTRALMLIDALLAAGAVLTFCSDARETPATEELRQKGVTCIRQAPNDSAFDTFVAQLQPEVTIFDRFTTEEKFGWRVRAACPDCLRVLDTIDLHWLRQARERAAASAEGPVASWPLPAALRSLAGDVAPREVAAIYRSDLSLLTSDLEERVLTTTCGVPPALLHLCRLTYAPPPPPRPWASRRGFVTIGNFRHAPNEDAVQWLRRDLWPRIRRLLPTAEVTVLGAYALPKHLAYGAPEQGFHVRGFVQDQFEELAARRVNLAPLRFGAGIKGKIADGWWSGTPVVTTAVGGEGMHEALPFGGVTADTADGFAQAAVTLHEQPEAWSAAAAAGLKIMAELFSPAATSQPLVARLAAQLADRDAARAANFTGQILWQQGLRSTEYFSRWIEAKQLAAKPPG